MIMRIAHSPAEPEAVRARFRQNFLERFLPALRQQPGLVAGFWAEAPDGGTRSITVWESRDLMEAGGRAASAAPLLPGFRPDELPGPHRGQTVEVLELTDHLLPGDGRG